MNYRLKIERLKLGQMLDVCSHCSFLYCGNHKSVHNYCKSSCNHHEKLQQQRDLVEKLLIDDREARGLSMHGILFQYERKERCDVIR